jgi:uncharacterized membrane protein
MRYLSIDVLRTVAIVVMVLVHFVENLSGVVLAISGFGAPLFSFLAGVSYCLWSEQQRKRCSEEQISKVSTRRGLFVLGVGFAFNILVWLPEDTFNWDVLTLIGTALVLLNGARHLPSPVLIAAAAASILVSPFLQAMADYHAYWLENYYDGDLTLSGILIGYFVVGYFPFFPWISYSLVGYVVGRHLFSEDAAVRTDWKSIVGIGLGLFLISLGLHWLTHQLKLSASLSVLSRHVLPGWTMFPPTVEYVVGTLGLTLMCLGGLLHYIDGSKSPATWAARLSLPTRFSRYSFSIYVLHHIAHVWPLWILAAVRGEEPTAYWRQALSVTYSAGLAILFLVALACFLSWRGDRTPIGLERSMRWLCD